MTTFTVHQFGRGSRPTSKAIIDFCTTTSEYNAQMIINALAKDFQGQWFGFSTKKLSGKVWSEPICFRHVTEKDMVNG